MAAPQLTCQSVLTCAARKFQTDAIARRSRRDYMQRVSSENVATPRLEVWICGK